MPDLKICEMVVFYGAEKWKFTRIHDGTEWGRIVMDVPRSTTEGPMDTDTVDALTQCLTIMRRKVPYGS